MTSREQPDPSYVPQCCEGVTCQVCGQQPAAHKLEEVIFDDDPQPIRHPLTAYACRRCFAGIMHAWWVAPLPLTR
jgi:hypothetical protein